MSAGAGAGPPPSAADAAVLDRWWREFAATGRLPAELVPVQGRLVRAVARGELPSGPVFVKVMTFPRTKDRLRYLLRALPGPHEAELLRATAAAGIACPAVVFVRSSRRRGLPFRSFLVLRALPTQATAVEAPACRLRDEAGLARRLLAAGIQHRDLHGGNFVRLVDGTLAVLDLQSASRRAAPATHRSARIAAAARLLREHLPLPAEAGAAVVAGGLLENAGELAVATRLAADARRRYEASRVWRCLGESTEFTRAVHWWGVEHRVRGELPPGRWLSGRGELRRCWIGQRARQLLLGEALVFPAFFRKWWWLGGKASLYVPRACEDRIEAELAAASEGFARFRRSVSRGQAELHGEQQD